MLRLTKPQLALLARLPNESESKRLTLLRFYEKYGSAARCHGASLRVAKQLEAVGLTRKIGSGIVLSSYFVRTNAGYELWRKQTLETKKTS